MDGKTGGRGGQGGRSRRRTRSRRGWLSVSLHRPKVFFCAVSFCPNTKKEQKELRKKNEDNPLSLKQSGISKPVVWGTRGLHPGFPWFSSFSWFP